MDVDTGAMLNARGGARRGRAIIYALSAMMVILPSAVVAFAITGCADAEGAAVETTAAPSGTPAPGGDGGGPAPGGGAPAPGGGGDGAPVFPCDVECVKSEAKRQGADVLTSLDNMKFSMDVVFSAAKDEGEACGQQSVFPAFKDLHLNPKLQLKLTTVHTRERPNITFQCSKGKSYHLVLVDSLGGAFQNNRTYTHWVKLNIECSTDKGWARVEDSGEDIKQADMQAIPGWFSGYGYLPPAFPYNAYHHFNFFIFETEKPFDADRVKKFNADFPANNVLGGGPWTITDIMEDLTLAAPVARTWMDVVTSYWSHLRMSRLEFMKDSDFVKLICTCNLASSWPGLNAAGLSACNL